MDCWVVIYNFIQNFKDFLWANSAELDQMPHSAAADLVLNCLPISQKKWTLGLRGLNQPNTVHYIQFSKYWTIPFKIYSTFHGL